MPKSSHPGTVHLTLKGPRACINPTTRRLRQDHFDKKGAAKLRIEARLAAIALQEEIDSFVL